MRTLLLMVALLALVAAARYAARRRRAFRLLGDAFRCRVRVCSFTSTVWRWLPRRWTRPMWARWDDDVLVVRRGPVVDREIRLRAGVTSDGVYVLPRYGARWCGRHPVAAGLTLSDGSQVEVVTDRGSRMALVGPYLAAAINNFPSRTRDGRTR